MSGEDIDPLSYVFVRFMLFGLYAIHLPVAFVFKGLDSSFQISYQRPALTYVEHTGRQKPEVGNSIWRQSTDWDLVASGLAYAILTFWHWVTFAVVGITVAEMFDHKMVDQPLELFLACLQPKILTLPVCGSPFSNSDFRFQLPLPALVSFRSLTLNRGSQFEFSFYRVCRETDIPLGGGGNFTPLPWLSITFGGKA